MLQRFGYDPRPRCMGCSKIIPDPVPALCQSCITVHTINSHNIEGHKTNPIVGCWFCP